MARPKAEVLLNYYGDTADWEVMRAQAVWVVEYQHRPICVTKTAWGTRGATIKYTRTNFSNPAHAYRLAEKLNKMFDSEEFTVREI